MFNLSLCNAATIRYSQLKFGHMHLCGMDYRYFSPHCCKCNRFGYTAAIRCSNACHGSHSDSLYSGSEHSQFNSPRLVNREAGFPNPRRALIGSNQLWRVNDSPYYREYIYIYISLYEWHNQSRSFSIPLTRWGREKMDADEFFKCIFLNENVWIPIEISLKFVPKDAINNIPAFVQITAWRRPGYKPLSKSIMVSLPTHICVTRPQWVKIWRALHRHDANNGLGKDVSTALRVHTSKTE